VNLDNVFQNDYLTFNFQGKYKCISITDKKINIDGIERISFNIYLTNYGDILGEFNLSFEEAKQFYKKINGVFNLEGENDDYLFNIQNIVIQSFINQEKKQT